MSAFLQDLRYAVRNLGNAPGFALVAAATLAIGIGANTAIFSIIDTILLRPLPYAHPGQLVRLNETEAAPGKYPFAGPDFVDWRAQNKTFQDMTLFAWPSDMNLNAGGQPEHVRGAAHAGELLFAARRAADAGAHLGRGRRSAGQRSRGDSQLRAVARAVSPATRGWWAGPSN